VVAGLDELEEPGREVLAEGDEDDVLAAALEGLDERDVVAVAGDDHDGLEVGAGLVELEGVDGELEVGGVPVHGRGDEHRLHAEQVERALDVACVLVEPGEVGVGAGDGHRVPSSAK
jgi:hypothetical protein